jgi:hypothetical protein
MVEASSYYWCLDHQQVEPPAGCANDRRMGPYRTRVLAAQALEHARSRTDAWDEEDEAWSGGS